MTKNKKKTRKPPGKLRTTVDRILVTSPVKLAIKVAKNAGKLSVQAAKWGNIAVGVISRVLTPTTMGDEREELDKLKKELGEKTYNRIVKERKPHENLFEKLFDERDRQRKTKKR